MTLTANSESLGANVSSGGNININTNSLALSGMTATATGDILITPRIAGTSIGLGAGAGTLQLSSAEMNSLHAGGHVTIGDAAAGTGLVTVNGLNTTSTSNFRLYGGDVAFAGNFASAGGDIAFTARTGNITGANGISILTNGGDLSLDADGTFTLGNTATVNAAGGDIAVHADSITTGHHLTLIGSDVALNASVGGIATGAGRGLRYRRPAPGCRQRHHAGRRLRRHHPRCQQHRR